MHPTNKEDHRCQIKCSELKPGDLIFHYNERHINYPSVIFSIISCNHDVIIGKIKVTFLRVHPHHSIIQSYQMHIQMRAEENFTYGLLVK